MTSTEKVKSARPEPVGGPAVVALGGGHGLAASLRAARTYAGSLTAVVSVGDDGGSSGRLRANFGVAPPGDVRRCISALATKESLLSSTLEFRFADGPLTGHPIGNLLLAGLTVASGDFQQAIDELCRLVGVEGSIFPATMVPVRLLADSDEGTITGQVTIERAVGIHNLRFDPADPPVDEGAVKAVEQADQVIIGPGSLFTSVLASAVVPGLLAAIQQTQGQRVFVANVANEKAMARGFGLAEHLEAILDHGVAIDVVVANESASVTALDGVEVYRADLAGRDGWSHDAMKLGRILSQIYAERRL
ncbi:MAG: uridine diphosphate-N-acetylglucosamine-binding protein YvcK [Actinomycetia bacterium]|nr:uridine diphosphate-N-acetylglucosamine-binding protein YvcK [Actinomycetes bacterium]MCP4223484.1 uridine diphosphate-N-acetylglucosamine-binding protein YvcK [Actinomycetes bacterium]MCP5032848.1 uridine diphosphate-N-acetylglucosamine-binding protein YvcK [Actinomycetes bacterium]